jgi:hypothetical protein
MSAYANDPALKGTVQLDAVETTSPLVIEDVSDGGITFSPSGAATTEVTGIATGSQLYRLGDFEADVASGYFQGPEGAAGADGAPATVPVNYTSVQFTPTFGIYSYENTTSVTNVRSLVTRYDTVAEITCYCTLAVNAAASGATQYIGFWIDVPPEAPPFSNSTFFWGGTASISSANGGGAVGTSGECTVVTVNGPKLDVYAKTRVLLASGSGTVYNATVRVVYEIGQA